MLLGFDTVALVPVLVTTLDDDVVDGCVKRLETVFAVLEAETEDPILDVDVSEAETPSLVIIASKAEQGARSRDAVRFIVKVE